MKKLKRIKKYLEKILASSTIATLLSYASKSVNFVVVLPLLLKNFKSNDIALWYLFSNILTIQLILDSGFSSTFIRILSYGTIGNRDLSKKTSFEEVRELKWDSDFIKTTIYIMKSLYKKIAFIFVLLFIMLGFWAFKLPISKTSNPTFGWIILGCVAFSLPILVFGSVYSNILQGINKITTLRLWETLFNLLSSITSILILIIFPNVYCLILAILFWALISIYRNKLLINNVPNIKDGNLDLSIADSIKKTSINNSLKSGIGVLFSQGITYISSFFYANYLESSLLASYLIAINLILNIKNFSQAPFYSKIPYFATLTASGNLSKLITLAKKAMQQVYLIFFVFSIMIWLLGFYYSSYLGTNSHFPSLTLWILLSFGFFIERYGAMHIQLYSTTNHILWHIHNGVSGTITIIVMIIIFNYIPVYSYPLGLIIGNITFYCWYGPLHSYRFLKSNFWDFEKYIFFPFLIIYSFIGYFILQNHLL